MKRLFYIILALIFVLPIGAQKLNVQVSTTKPAVGVPFEIMFSTNAQMQDFVPPNFSNFEVISGPNHSQNIQFINGNLSQSSSISYVLIPKKEGAVVIGAAKAIINGQSVYSSPITLDVQKNPSGNNYSSASQQRNNNSPSIPEKANENDIFVRTSVNKKQCYLGEQITLTQKIYTRIELRGIQNVKFPHLEGFWSKNQENTGNIQLHIENIDGVNYYVGEISKQFLFPQRTGKLTISPIEIDCVVRKRTNRPPRDIFEQFFGVNAYEDKVVSLKSQPITINVTDLPNANKPANYTGAVGTHFSFKVEVNRTKLPANDAVNLKVSISGTGNIPIVDAPKINFPPEFETYDPKISENISTANGVSGTKTYEYLIIPRKEGIYKLSDISFSYFNLNSNNYVTIPSPEIAIEVTPPIGNNNNTAQVYQQFKQEIKSEDNDIHYIKPYPFKVYQSEETFFNSSTHIALNILPYIAMLVLFGFYQIRKSERADWATFQQKRAQKIALKHLSSVEKLLSTSQSSEIYTAIIQALENYFMFRFKVNKSEISRDKIKDTLSKNNIPENLIQQFLQIMDTCEMAKYAPLGVNQSLQQIYTDAKNLIVEIEKEVRNT